MSKQIIAKWLAWWKLNGIECQFSRTGIMRDKTGSLRDSKNREKLLFLLPIKISILTLLWPSAGPQSLWEESTQILLHLYLPSYPSPYPPLTQTYTTTYTTTCYRRTPYLCYHHPGHFLWALSLLMKHFGLAHSMNWGEARPVLWWIFSRFLSYFWFSRSLNCLLTHF